MNSDDELLSIYAVEAADEIGTLTKTLMQFEAARGAPAEERRRLLEILARAAHSLKGASRAVGRADVEKLAHRIESVFAAVMATDQVLLDPAKADAVYRAIDLIQQILDSGESTELDSVLSSLDTLHSELGKVGKPADSPPLRPSNRDTQQWMAMRTQEIATAAEAPETIRVSISNLDDLMADTSDLAIARYSIEQRLVDLRLAQREQTRWRQEWRKARTAYIRAVRESATQADWNTLLAFIDASQQYMRSGGQQLLAVQRALVDDTLRLGLIADSLQEHVRQARLVPFETRAGLLQRAVRDVARTRGKEIMLQIIGASIALDKRVLESLEAPLIHLLRNAADHGIELPADRESAGKPRSGAIVLALSQHGGQVTILVSDDGRGIDVAAVRLAASRLFSDLDTSGMETQELLSLIMLPGLSTASQVTDISGRGIGLDILRQNIEAVQGRVSIETTPGQGTTFKLVVPVSLSTLRCTLVRISSETYAIPTTAIEYVVGSTELEAAQQNMTAGRPMLTSDGGRAVGLVTLAEVLERPAGGPYRYSVVISSGDHLAGLMVDDVLTDQEVIVKNLGPELAGTRHVFGAAVAGSGDVIIVLNASDLVKTAHSRLGTPYTPPAVSTTSDSVSLVTPTILVVDDSITTRTLEKNILEAAGYPVITATDGLEALHVLQRTPCVLVVADVQMPHMDGFELTTQIRQNKRFSHLPVVLVTSLDTDEYKERGLQAGANAYIVKGGFDQGELLSTIKQFIGRASTSG